MSLRGDYQTDNVFARVLRGEVPAVTVFEDTDVLAMMDLFPQAEGHVLVLSKRSTARNILEIEPEALSTVMLAVRRIARAIDAALAPDGLVVTQFSGAAAGQTVFHLHVHVIPRYAGSQPRAHASGSQADRAELIRVAERIRSRID